MTLFLCQSKIEKVLRGIQVEKSSKDMATLHIFSHNTAHTYMTVLLLIAIKYKSYNVSFISLPKWYIVTLIFDDNK